MLHPTKNLGKLLSQTGLVDLHWHRHPSQPRNTLNIYCRQHTVNICLGNMLFTQALTGAWYLPFGKPDTLPGDHQTIGLDFDWKILFGDKLPPTIMKIHCRVNSNVYPMVKECSNMVVKGCQQHWIAQQIETPVTIPKFTEGEHNTLECIDYDLTQILACQSRWNVPEIQQIPMVSQTTSSVPSTPVLEPTIKPNQKKKRLF